VSRASQRRIASGAGLGVGALLVAPAAAQAEDFTVTNLNPSGDGSLRGAILEANANGEADRILFSSKLSGAIHLEAALEVYGEDLEIVGPGARKLSVDADGDGRVFEIIPLSPIDVVISGLTLTDGYASTGGGGIAVFGPSDVTVSRTAITDSHTLSSGGGIAVLDAASVLRVESSTISGNTAPGARGGGIYAQEAEVSIRNSTISGNAATQNLGLLGGGGIWVGSELLTIENSTIAGNSARYGGGVFTQTADVALMGTVVADNTASQGPDLYEDFALPASFGGSFNLIEDDSGTDGVPGAGNIVDVDPKLKPLANNGGPTDTQAFKKSPAKNKLPKDQTPKSDQRGAKRKSKGDIGAYELVKCEGVIVNRVGTAKKDKLKGTKRKDGILGLGGNDKLSGKKGKDGLCGGRGKDKLKGGPGKDKLDGGPGKDKEVQ
jgi:predicted outer membrane repeat protein